MLWFFERHDSRLHYEVRRQPDGDDFELVITQPDGRQDVEQFADALHLVDRMQRLQRSLRDDGWTPPPRVTPGRAGAYWSPSSPESRRQTTPG
jgi:hypothetical protein